MAVKVSPDQLGQAILKGLEIYTEEVSEAVSKAVQDVGKDSAKELRTINQVSGSNVWEQYPKGWAVQNTKRKGRTISEVHNKEHYRLTHLLENGHVIKNGTGRTYGSTRKFEHIKPVEEKAVKELEKKIMEAIEKA